jgi:hypothetical protein
MTNIFKTTAIAGAFIGTLALIPATMRADERKYHDTAHNDDHNWSNHEDRAYRMWVKENHRKYRNFEILREEDRQTYWGWRHEHDDARLRIVIR